MGRRFGGAVWLPMGCNGMMWAEVGEVGATAEQEGQLWNEKVIAQHFFGPPH